MYKSDGSPSRMAPATAHLRGFANMPANHPTLNPYPKLARLQKSNPASFVYWPNMVKGDSSPSIGSQ